MTASVEHLRQLYREPDARDLLSQLQVAVEALDGQAAELMVRPNADRAERFAANLSGAVRMASRLADALRREGAQ